MTHHTPLSNPLVALGVCMVQSGIQKAVDTHIDPRTDLHTDPVLHMDDDTVANTETVANIHMGVVGYYIFFVRTTFIGLEVVVVVG